MANKKSSIKDVRRIASRTDQNRRVRSRLKSLSKKVSSLASTDDKEARASAAREYVSALDKAAKTGIIHANQASRHKADCAKYLA